MPEARRGTVLGFACGKAYPSQRVLYIGCVVLNIRLNVRFPGFFKYLDMGMRDRQFFIRLKLVQFNELRLLLYEYRK
jgi:hypothetical protein